MQTLTDAFEELYGTYDMAANKLEWTRKLEIFINGWKAGQQGLETDQLSGERGEME
jgi:hypothetical protein